MSILRLCLTFFKIGCVAWGGGYAMIPLLERELIGPGWLSSEEFLDIVAVSEMTPGPIAVNSATFVGHRFFGLLGGALATLSVIAPSIILVFTLLHFLARYRNHPLVDRAMSGIHAAVVVLITCAGLYILPVAVVDFKRVILALVSFFLITRTELNSVLLILLGGVVGMILVL
ncbi:MAG: chromate transporter [Firmicutes bacterium]|nr:chromate transporter [Bacillota bacterium]